MRFGDLTFEEIHEEITAGAIAVVPMGCTEQQGPHLPVDFDTWFGETLASEGSDRASEQHGIRSLVLPTLPFGPTPEHVNFGAGYVDLPAQQHDDILVALLGSLFDQGFNKVVVWRGCGGHDLSRPVASVDPSRGRVWLPAMPFESIWREVGPEVPGGHADSFTTSITMYLRPDSLRSDRIPGPSRVPDWTTPVLDFALYSETGVIGDPRHASAELGRRAWDRSVAWFSDYLLDVARS